MFPKAHAVAYTMMSIRVAWYKYYKPLEYYATYFTTRCDTYDVATLIAGERAVKEKYFDIQNKKNNKGFKKLSVANSIKINGKAFKVISVAGNAFAGYGNLKIVVIGKNIASIGNKSFNNCKKLNKITINYKKLKSIGNKAVNGINKKAVIKVPGASLKNYKKLFKAKTGYKKTMKISK